MILLDASTSELAQLLVDATGRLVDKATITKSFVDSFAPKATSTILKRTTPLEFLYAASPFAPRCLFEKPWSSAWIKSRHKFGLDSSAIALPTYHEQSRKFGMTRMSSSEASLWIRELLCLTGTSEKVADTVSSHGLKATLLSWVAKSGKFSTTEQRCLGHHFDPELRSVLIYSRDSYAPLAADTPDA